MTKLSVDLLDSSESKISSERLNSVTRACLETLIHLGKLGEMVEVFRVTWVCGYNESGLAQHGPQFTIYFHDPLGQKSFHTVDYRFIGKGSTNPSSESIVEHLCKCLPRLISEHVERCGARLQKAQQVFSVLSKT